ncbi:universal stress protein [Streptomyces canus]|uniref:universal stress protein n=1 Tax=Streptomyces canus TaxID=58343 RepID=UPI00367F12AC
MESSDGTLIEAEERAPQSVPQADVSCEVTVGEPLTVLEIESRTASHVMVGNRGLGEFGSLLLGSAAVHLAAHGRRPLLVVRGRPDPNNSALLAIDGSPVDENVAEFAFTKATNEPSGSCVRRVATAARMEGGWREVIHVPEAVSVAGKAATRSGDQLMGESHEGWSADRRR